MCLALLLVVLAVVMATQGETRQTGDPLSGIPRELPSRTLQETRASNLAELPPLEPYDTPPGLTSIPAPVIEASGQPTHSEKNKPKPRKYQFPLLKLLFP